MRFPYLLGVSVIVLALPGSGLAQYQTRGDITFFSKKDYGGSRYTVTSPRQNVRVPFTVRSVLIRSGGSWQVCTRTDYRNCSVVSRSDRSTNIAVRSARPLGYTQPGYPGSRWREIARLGVRQGVQWDSVQVRNSNQRYRQVTVCAERNVVRIARMDAFFNNGQRQTFHTPLTLRPGQCSRAMDLQGQDRRIRSLSFTYQGWNPAYRGAVVVVRGI